MKKIFLMAALAVGCVLNSQANTFTFLNLSGCTFTYHVAGDNPSTPGIGFASSPITVPPGNMVFPTPSSLPGLATLPATVNYHMVRGWVNSTPTYTANAGDGTVPSFTTPVSIPSLPCNNSQGGSVSWNASNGNIVVLMF
jgi:hypothetical protein